MEAIEGGGKSKETIKSEFLQAYPGSEEKSTFRVFFSDVIRQYGSASVSRSIRIETDAQGHVYFEVARAELVKASITKGILQEIGAIEKGKYPKKDLNAIEEVLHKYWLPLKQ